MSEDPQHTLGALLARLEAREQQIAEQAGAAHEKIAELTALLSELDQATEYIKITRKTLLELPDEASPPTHAPTTTVPDNAACRQILAVFAEADGPLRARHVCEAMDLEIVPNNVNNVRTKLKRLVRRGVLTETEPGLFTQPRP
ncbi:hypothetical protein [Streptomyces hiroshimensis]|uniref:MarR family transcriptional regulator n=1 Tax=Streptomyces hiroshimensis TaxID=66424 RepID=A0ABQ2Y5Q8_9ACTN|nr:hypothetical protein [Streptomyces hiroshimensis]GGX67452.1 hypothetical protein GCM10010324_10960 [Streptomyces hiroshimensis]